LNEIERPIQFNKNIPNNLYAEGLDEDIYFPYNDEMKGDDDKNKKQQKTLKKS